LLVQAFPGLGNKWQMMVSLISMMLSQRTALSNARLRPLLTLK
jgi:hypothetical protein